MDRTIILADIIDFNIAVINGIQLKFFNNFLEETSINMHIAEVEITLANARPIAAIYFERIIGCTIAHHSSFIIYGLNQEGDTILAQHISCYDSRTFA